jgi:hypothetical protein|tara:strand:- start:193 stop:714 length:522 start_codon:yes stop_codon:yes gene_type:complete
MVKTFLFFLFIVGLASIAQAQTKRFCAECHTSREISSFGNVLAWGKSIYQEKNHPCPSAKRLKEEGYFTESRIVKYGQVLDQLEKNRILTGRMKKGLLQQTVAYSEAIALNPVSQEDIAAQTAKIKNNLNKTYLQINQVRDRLKTEKVFGLGVLTTLLMIFSILLGIEKTFKG